RNDRVVVLRVDASETDGLPHKHRDAFGLHFLHDFGAIAFDRPHTDTQPGGDRVTSEAFRDEVEDFDLSRCQSRKIPAEGLLRLLQMLPLEGPRKCPVDRCDELGIVHRFFDKVFRSGLDPGHRHRHIGVTGYEDDRKRDLSTAEFADEFYAVCPGHADIGYYATRRQLIYRLKKGVSRDVGLDGESEHTQHLPKRVANRFWIVYEKDRGPCFVMFLAIKRAAAKMGTPLRPPPASGARGARHAIRQSTGKWAGQGRGQPLSMLREARIAGRPIPGRPRDHCPTHRSRHVGARRLDIWQFRCVRQLYVLLRSARLHFE